MRNQGISYSRSGRPGASSQAVDHQKVRTRVDVASHGPSVTSCHRPREWSRRGTSRNPSSGWIESREKGQLGCILFDEADELLVENDSIIGADMRFETGLIEVLLEDKELTRVVAFTVNGELSVTRL
jgi:hypothetical protein